MLYLMFDNGNGNTCGIILKCWLSLFGLVLLFLGFYNCILLFTHSKCVELFISSSVYRLILILISNFQENVSIINQKRMECPEENQSMSGKVKHITSAIALVLNYLFKPTNVQKYQAYFFREIKLKKKQSQVSKTCLHFVKVYHFLLALVLCGSSIFTQ